MNRVFLLRTKQLTSFDGSKMKPSASKLQASPNATESSFTLAT